MWAVRLCESFATGVVEFLHGDLVGSTRAVTDSSGAVVGAWDYSIFGVVTTATGGASGDGVGVTRFLFAGEYLDDTGLYYLRARFYDPVTASFVSVDPALSVTVSPYAYASGNPLQLVDPLGLFSIGGFLDDVGDGLKSAASATGNWIADHKAEIVGVAVGVVVFAGCSALLGPTAGPVGLGACGALAGAAGSATTYAMDTPKECWTAGGFFVSAGMGALVGGVTAGGGAALRPLATRAVSAVASRATPTVQNAISKTLTVIKPSGGGGGLMSASARSGNRVFWSGGQGAKGAAANFATSNGSTTLEMTTVGRVLDRLPYNRFTAKLWDAASAGFAVTARGEANVFIGAEFKGAQSVFGRIEGPILNLKRNPILQRFEDAW